MIGLSRLVLQVILSSWNPRYAGTREFSLIENVHPFASHFVRFFCEQVISSARLAEALGATALHVIRNL
jgi:hypothetical protein